MDSDPAPRCTCPACSEWVTKAGKLLDLITKEGMTHPARRDQSVIKLAEILERNCDRIPEPHPRWR